MTITDRVLDILFLLRTFKYLTTALIRRWCVPTDKDGSVTREIMRKLLKAGYVKRYKAEMVDPLVNSTAPVYVPTVAGCAVLATVRKDMALQLDRDPPQAWQNLAHYVSVSDVLLKLRAAVLRQSVAEIAAMFLEHDVINSQADDPADKYMLYTTVKSGAGTGKVVCVPDALVGLKVGDFQTAYYIERETGSDTPARVAAKKTPGYAGLAESERFKKHLPAARKMRVLVVAPNAVWRDAILKELRKKPAKELWLAVSNEDIEPETFLHAPILHACDGEPTPLLKVIPGSPPAAPPMAYMGTERAMRAGS